MHTSTTGWVRVIAAFCPGSVKPALLRRARNNWQSRSPSRTKMLLMPAVLSRTVPVQWWLEVARAGRTDLSFPAYQDEAET